MQVNLGIGSINNQSYLEYENLISPKIPQSNGPQADKINRIREINDRFSKLVSVEFILPFLVFETYNLIVELF